MKNWSKRLIAFLSNANTQKSNSSPTHPLGSTVNDGLTKMNQRRLGGTSEILDDLRQVQVLDQYLRRKKQ
jgi:hypothetical protein